MCTLTHIFWCMVLYKCISLTSVDDVIIIRATLCRCPAVLHLAMQEFHSEAKSVSNAHWIKTVLWLNQFYTFRSKEQVVKTSWQTVWNLFFIPFAWNLQSLPWPKKGNSCILILCNCTLCWMKKKDVLKCRNNLDSESRNVAVLDQFNFSCL